jgi:hypothetical protein
VDHSAKGHIISLELMKDSLLSVVTDRRFLSALLRFARELTPLLTERSCQGAADDLVPHRLLLLRVGK